MSTGSSSSKPLNTANKEDSTPCTVIARGEGHRQWGLATQRRDVGVGVSEYLINEG